MAGFVWYELMTDDVEAAHAFYEAVIGWRFADSGMPGVDYRMASAADRRVAGMMASPDGAPAMWTGYAHVEDVAAGVERVRAGGGQVHRDPAPVPGVGTFAVVADPFGAVFQLFTPAPVESAPQPPFDPAAPRVLWLERVDHLRCRCRACLLRRCARHPKAGRTRHGAAWRLSHLR